MVCNSEMCSLWKFEVLLVVHRQVHFLMVNLPLGIARHDIMVFESVVVGRLGCINYLRLLLDESLVTNHWQHMIVCLNRRLEF